MGESERYYSAEKNEIGDSIKLDSSSLSPQEMKEVKSTATQIAETIIKTYKDVISPETLARNKDISERIVVTDNVGDFAYEWEPEVRGSKTPIDTIIGASFQEGGIVTILNPRIAWERLSIKSKEIYIEEAGDEENAKRQYEREFLGRTLTHELLHQYGNWDEEQEFLECGVGYYEEQLLRLLRIPHYPSGQRDKMNDFYASLRIRYGGDVDRMFFGSKANQIQKSAIINELTMYKENLFPEGHGL